MALKLVFEPIRIGSVEVANRIVRTAHATMFSHQGVNDDLIAYHEARARSGVGLSILEAASVHPTSHLSLRVSDDSAIAGYERLMKAIRPHGMRVFQQLWHGGHHYPGPGGRLPWGVSSIPSPATGWVAIPMGKAEIEELVQAFAEAARRCREGGLDGVEIHGAHGYLVHQFLSPLTNNRTDEYGGSLANRMRFLQETLRAIRRTVGPDFVVGVRLSASTVPGGLTEEDLAQVARTLEAEGLIDYLNVSWGDYYESNRSSGAMDEPFGYELQSSAKITAAVKVPRIIAGRYRTLEEADQTLREGHADLISMVRAHIADPDLIRKTREGRADQVRPCIACNQACIGGLIRVGRMGCVVNVAAGFEHTLSEELIERTSNPRKVLIVGGGPAGMEAARVAALAGHRVKLVEASNTLGGALNVARRVPRAHTIGDIADWLERELHRLGVEVVFGTYVEADDVRREAPDAVIVATGSVPRVDGIQVAVPGQPVQGVDLPHVLSTTDLIMATPKDLGTSALVLDDLGHFEAIAAAEFLLEKGLSVTYVTRFPTVAPVLNTQGRADPALKRFYRRDFRLLTRYALVSIETGKCTVRPLLSERCESVAADTVVLVSPNEPLRDLWLEIRTEVPYAAIVGDAHSPRELQSAIREGHLAARAIQ